MRTILVGLFSFALILPAAARHHHHHHLTHKYARYLASRHLHYHHYRHYHVVHQARKARRHAGNSSYIGTLSKIEVDGGQRIVVNRTFADRFIGFFHELFMREGRLPEIGCYAAHGHMPLPWGRHPAGEACDVGQRARNRAWAPMLAGRVTQLANRWGLTDGATWRNPDGGHIQINRAVATVPAVIVLALRRKIAPEMGPTGPGLMAFALLHGGSSE